MIGISKLAFDAVKDAEPMNLIGWWKKSKPATVWIVLCLIFEIPLEIIKRMIMIVCFIPHKIYEELEE